MDANLPKPRSWFRFSLRTMFVLVTVLCVVLSWSAYQLNWIRQRHDFLKNDRVATHDTYKNNKAPYCLRLFGEPGRLFI
jgi:hypothetical protein